MALCAEAHPVHDLAVPSKVHLPGARAAGVALQDRVWLVRRGSDDGDVMAAFAEPSHESTPTLLGCAELRLVVVGEEENPHWCMAVCDT